MSSEQSPMSDAPEPESGEAAQSGMRGVLPAAGPPLSLGTVIDARYELTAKIGAGGMGYVFEALDQRLQRSVAIKVIRRELAENKSLATRFQREALASSRLTHPHVVVVHDFGATDDGLPYLVMERLHGETLTRAIKRAGRLDPRRSVELAADVARALVAAHDASIVHRDLKPDNVFLTKRGRAKVLDFGIAKILEGPGGAMSSVSLTTTGMMMGTPLYMSPESIKKEQQVGPPSDLYALGTILFRMLTGDPPFVHDEPVVVLSMHLQNPPPRLADVLPDLDAPPALQALLDDLLQKEPGARPTAPQTLRRLEHLASRIGSTSEVVALDEEEVPPLSIHEEKTAVVAAPTMVTPAPEPDTPVPAGPEASPAPASEASGPDRDFALAGPTEPSEASPPAAASPGTVAGPATPERSRLILVALGAGGIAALLAPILIAVLWMSSGSDEVTATELQGAAAPLEPEGAETEPAALPEASAEETAGAAEPDEAGEPTPTPPEAEPEEPPEPEPAAASPEPETPRTGRLVLRTDVPAQITVDGEPRGSSPATLELPAGDHRIQLAAGGRRRILTVHVGADETVRRALRLAPRRPSPEPAPEPRGGGGGGLELPDQW